MTSTKSVLHPFDRVPKFIGDSNRALGLVVKADDHRVSVRGDAVLLLADHGMLDRQAGVAQPRYLRADVDGIRITKLPPVVTRYGCQKWRYPFGF